MTFQPKETSSDASPPLSDAAFERIAKRIFEKSGIVLAGHKKKMAQARIARRLNALNFQDFETYLDFLDTPAAANEQSAFIDALTTNLTSFFREPHHFDHLKSELLPKLKSGSSTRARIWSAACSTGEEPYSISCIVKGLRSARPDLDVKILATDIDTNVLAQAAKGEYPADRISELASDYSQYFRGMTEDDRLVISDELKSPIHFKNLNLFEPWPFQGMFDAIFCRNVIIYFETNERRMLVDRMVERLQPGGYLYLGHSEALVETHQNLQNEGHTIYRKLP